MAPSLSKCNPSKTRLESEVTPLLLQEARSSRLALLQGFVKSFLSTNFEERYCNHSLPVLLFVGHSPSVLFVQKLLNLNSNNFIPNASGPYVKRSEFRNYRRVSLSALRRAERSRISYASLFCFLTAYFSKINV